MNDVARMTQEYGYTNFKTSVEEWSEYILEDGTILRIKTVPLKIRFDGKGHLLNSTHCLASFSPEELRGAPSFKPVDELNFRDKVDKSDMKFEAKNEPWNEYELDDGIGTKLFIKTVILQVSKTNMYDSYGDPIYWVNHQTLTKKYPI